jgi:cell fate regulator YaaT (PSP1 superfamily)
MSKPLPVIQPLAPPGAEHLVEVAFKGNRRGFYTTSDDTLLEGEYVVVDAERGQDLGRVRSVGGVARSKCSSTGAEASFPIVRRAEPEEARAVLVLRADEDRVRRQTRELVDRHNLKMKVSDAEWQWDRNKLTIYFTAERRVDFRELVRELARTFRTRIELKQIGVRDEAAMLGGLGRCGRQLCCATWLREIRPVSLQLAKDQNLSLNPSQISGTCGRLMCCLTYEHDAYLQARKRFPREGKILQTSLGAEKVIGIDIWRETVTLLDDSRQRRVVPLADLKKEMAAAPAPARRERAAADEPGARPAAEAGQSTREPRAERPARRGRGAEEGRAGDPRAEAPRNEASRAGGSAERPRAGSRGTEVEAAAEAPAAEAPERRPQEAAAPAPAKPEDAPAADSAPRRRGRRGSGRQRREAGPAAEPPTEARADGDAVGSGPVENAPADAATAEGEAKRRGGRGGRRRRGSRGGGGRDE